jgi:hypothetical protein
MRCQYWPRLDLARAGWRRINLLSGIKKERLLFNKLFFSGIKLSAVKPVILKAALCVAVKGGLHFHN